MNNCAGKFVLPLLLILLLLGCGGRASEPKESASAPDAAVASGSLVPGSISGIVSAETPRGAFIYVGIGDSYDHLAVGRALRGTILAGPGPFMFENVAPGSYRVGAFVDLNGNRIPDVPLEPYIIQSGDVTVLPGEHIDGIVIDSFFNQRSGGFRNPERMGLGAKMFEKARDQVEQAYEKLKQEKSNLLYSVIPTLRSMIYEAEQALLVAGNESDWEQFTGLLEHVPVVAEGAMRGENLLGTLRGCFLRAYISKEDDSVQRYAVYVPESYDGSRPFPLVVALHGAGGDHWSGLKMVAGYSAFVVGAEESNRHFYPRDLPPDFIIACPNGHGYDGPGYRGKGEYDVIKVLKEMFSNYNIDSDRVYLTGASKGGSGTWEIGLKYPELFAGIAPVCGAARQAETMIENAGDMKIFVFHGRKDAIIPVQESRRMVVKLTEAGAFVEYTELEDLGHETSVVVYKDGMIFDLFRG